MAFRDTVKKTALGIAAFPATAVSWVADKFFGTDRVDLVTDRNGYTSREENKKHGLVTWMATAFSSFISRHKTAIAAAFWISLALTTAAVLTAFFWPAALAAVVSFSVAGFSIAGIVGTGLGAQLGVIAGLAAVGSVALSVVGVHIAAILTSVYNFFKECCGKQTPSTKGAKREISLQGEKGTTSAKNLRELGAQKEEETSDPKPGQYKSPLQQPNFEATATATDASLGRGFIPTT